jgi:5-methylcytosine-specific restriction endonuclease McrA
MSAFVQAGGILRCHACAVKRKKARKLERERERRQEMKATGDPRYDRLCERENQKCHRRRARLAEAPSDLTADAVLRIKRAAKCCALCGGGLPKRVTSRQLDHIIPIFAKGTHTRDNVRVLCIRCNAGRPKDGSDVSEFQMNLWMGRDDS